MENLEERIGKLEVESRKLDPPKENRQSLLNEVNKYAESFLHRTQTGKGFTAEDQSGSLEKFPVSEEGTDITDLLEGFEMAVEKPGINPASGGHLGYIPGGGLYPAALGDYLAAITNRYAGVYFANPGAVRMENMLCDWMREMINFPNGSAGTLCSGGSIANLVGITAARDAGMISGSAVEKAVVYSTSQTHHSLHKALRIAGLGEVIHREIAVDKQYKMQINELESTVKKDRTKGLNPFLVVSSAGTTDTGVVDPLNAISSISKTYNLWHHVDAAYGGFFILVDQLQELFLGIEHSDSVTIDPHKGLFLPYGTGAVIVRDSKALLKSHHYLANYMRDTQTIDQLHSPADISPELSRHFRGLRMWLPLKLFGLKIFRKALEEKHLLALYFHHKVQELGFETGPSPELSVVIYRYSKNLPDEESNAFNQKLIEMCHSDGRVFLSSTVIENKVWLRFAVLSFRTHRDTVDVALEMLKELLNRLK